MDEASWLLLPNYCRCFKVISLQFCMCQCFVCPHFYHNFDLYVNETRLREYGVSRDCEALAADSTLKLCIHKNEFFSSRLIIFHSSLSDHRILLHMARQEKSPVFRTSAAAGSFGWVVFSPTLTTMIPRVT